MEKDFFGWAGEKQRLHEKRKVTYFSEREVWWCALGVNIGHEQDGKGRRFARPVVIVKKFSAQTCIVVPLTTREKKGRFYASLGTVKGRPVTAIISQIRLIDRRRLLNKLGTVKKDAFEDMRKAVRDLIS